MYMQIVIDITVIFVKPLFKNKFSYQSLTQNGVSGT
jgi:hypothetical protein